MAAMTSKHAIERLVRRGNKFDKRVEQFKKTIVLHRNFEQGILEVAERMEYGGQQAITAVLGPTGSGKTALATEVAYQFEQAALAMPADMRPCVLYCELAAPETGAFNWKVDFYKPLLTALRDPCVNAKIDVSELRTARFEGRHAWALQREPTIAEYREMLFKAFDRAKVMALLIDEADHFKRSTERDGVFRQYDNIKSRSNSTSTHFVLCGTTAVKDIFSQSGQISRRVYPVWMLPYGPDEIAHFSAAVMAITRNLPFPLSFNLMQKMKKIHEECFGLVGVAHEWFERALIKCIAQNREELKWEDFWELRLHEMQKDGIMNELISFGTFQHEYRQTSSQKQIFLFGQREQKPAPESKGHRKPGERNPVRDAVPS